MTDPLSSRRAVHEFAGQAEGLRGLPKRRSNDRKLLGYTMGEVMCASSGRADPAAVRRRLERALKEREG